jgi:hypothetical protein
MMVMDLKLKCDVTEMQARQHNVSLLVEAPGANSGLFIAISLAPETDKAPRIRSNLIHGIKLLQRHMFWVRYGGTRSVVCWNGILRSWASWDRGYGEGFRSSPVSFGEKIIMSR